VTITNSSSALTNHQVGEIVLNDDSPVDLNLFQASGQDARFADTTATAISDYWIQSWNAGQAKVWVKMPSLPASQNTIIYLYGGNSTVSNNSNYSNTFTKISNSESGLVGLWHMDTGSGTTLTDSSGNGNNGSFVGDVNWVGSDGGRWDGVSQQFSSGDHLNIAGNYSGNWDYVNCGDINALDRPDYFTFEVWFNRTVDNAGTGNDTNHLINNVLVAQSSVATNDNLEIGTEGTNVELYVDTAGTTDSFTYNAGILNNTWYHLVVTYDRYEASGNELKLYLDGVLKTQWNTPQGYLRDSATSPLTFGKSRPTKTVPWGDLGGYMDEMAIYNRALSLEEIQAHYYRRKYANPQPFENGVGSLEAQ
jgi:hypothetical protein